MQLSGPTAQPTTIDLYGTVGEFKVANGQFTIRYLSTFASPRNKDGHAALLEQLLPMRDRVKAAELNDLRSLLQRDLNDRRVARELVPYLKGERAPVGFFPAVLAALMPKGYLGNRERLGYPVGEETSPRTYDYDGCWTLTKYESNGTELPLALLKVSIAQAEIIVLDGQHRATAFRYACGAFDPAGDIHKVFYQGSVPPDGYVADLPVTLIWFEGDRPIDPTLVSRRLFVDVNNNAKPVSISRNILLDDYALTRIGTQQLYKVAAKRNFDPSRFSLLHSAFDMDSDLSRGKLNAFALTAPEIIEEAVLWGLLGTSSYDGLDKWQVERRRSQKYTTRLINAIPVTKQPSGTGQDEDGPVYFRESEDAEEFRNLFDAHYLGVWQALFDGLSLLDAHYRAARTTVEDLEASPDTRKSEVWERVFCGGEGLYWTMPDPNDPATRLYDAAIRQIETEFRDVRAELLGVTRTESDAAFESFVTKVMATGFIMAVDRIAYQGDANHVEAAQALVESLNDLTISQLVAVLTKFRPALIGSSGANPNLWPSYRNLLLRIYDERRGEFYTRQSYKETPEWRVFSRKLEGRGNSLADTSATMPEDEELHSLSSQVYAETMSLVSECGLSNELMLPESKWLDEGVEFLRSKLQSQFPQDSSSADLLVEVDHEAT